MAQWAKTCNKYDLLMRGIKMESPAKFIFGWITSVDKVGVSLFNTWTTIEFQRGLVQHGYDLKNLTSMRYINVES